MALVVVGGILRVLIARQDLFADEVATYWVVSAHSLWGVVKTVSTTAEISPPLSFVLSWLTTRTGLSPELLRLPALIAGVATIPMVYAVGIRTVGRRGALLAAALTTFSPFMLYYSAEARGYAVTMALVLGSTLALLLAVDTGRRRWWVVYGACVCLAAYNHYTVAFVLAAQFVWALWALWPQPRSRRALILATAAAVVIYLPWLPSLKGDFDSPTTQILNLLSPFNLTSARVYLEHWTLGFPYSGPGRELSDLPGVPALILLGASFCLGAYGLFTMRRRLGARLAAVRGRAVLVVLLALATPVGAAISSAVGNHVFSTRNLAASWPYLALATSALITAGRPALRMTAAALAVVAFTLGAAGMFRSEFTRPEFSTMARWLNDYARGKGVVIDAAVFTPGPLSNFDLEGSKPEAPVLRLTVSEQRSRPFAVFQPRPDPADVARRAAAVAGDGPIILVAGVNGKGLANFATDPFRPMEDAFVKALPAHYRLIRTKVVNGGLGAGIKASVYCPARRLRCVRP